jgi:hypothetical protein
LLAGPRCVREGLSATGALSPIRHTHGCFYIRRAVVSTQI